MRTPEQIKAYNKKYYKLNREILIEKHKKYYAEHKNKKYSECHKEDKPNFIKNIKKNKLKKIDDYDLILDMTKFN